MLLISDGFVFSAADQDLADQQIARLHDAGFALRGTLKADTNGARGASPSADADTELLASLKSRIAIAPFNSQPAADAIRSWLADHPEFDMVLWIGRDDQARASAWLVPASDADLTAVTAARKALDGQSGSNTRSKP